MIITEYFTTRSDGAILNRTYSDAGMLIERDGIQYEEAIDPADANRQYIETDIPVLNENVSEESEKAQAYDILTGVIE